MSETAKNKKAHKKIGGILTNDSKNIPTTNEIQRKNSILDGLIFFILFNNNINLLLFKPKPKFIFKVMLDFLSIRMGEKSKI